MRRLLGYCLLTNNLVIKITFFSHWGTNCFLRELLKRIVENLNKFNHELILILVKLWSTIYRRTFPFFSVPAVTCSFLCCFWYRVYFMLTLVILFPLLFHFKLLKRQNFNDLCEVTTSITCCEEQVLAQLPFNYSIIYLTIISIIAIILTDQNAKYTPIY